MTDKYSEAVISDLARLLNGIRFSDLVLRCEGQDFKVHKCILTLRSKYFATACSGEFQVRLSTILALSWLTKYHVEGSAEECHRRDDGRQVNIDANVGIYLHWQIWRQFNNLSRSWAGHSGWKNERRIGNRWPCRRASAATKRHVRFIFIEQ